MSQSGNGQSYWRRRYTRRRVIVTGGAVGTGVIAATLIGCGDDDDDGGSSTPSGSQSGPHAGRFASTDDASGNAIQGGIYKAWWESEEQSLDALVSPRSGPPVSGPSEPANSRMLREEEIPGEVTSAVITGDLAESFELQPDGLRLTMKLRPDAHFDPRPPTNGRAVTADDIVFSLNKMFSLSPYASELSNEKNPSSPVESIQKIDDRTVQYNLGFPWAPLLLALSHGHHIIQPTEADSEYDPRTEVRNSGPWMLEVEPSVALHWRRNPGWHRLKDEGIPYLEGYDAPILPEVATRISQFRAGGIWDYTPTNADDVLQTVRDVSEIKLVGGDLLRNFVSLTFGSRPDSPFRDIRVRQAASMAVDRESAAFAVTGADTYAKEGIDYPNFPVSHVSPGWGQGFWLDPRTDELGEGAKYFKFDPAEARKLLAAAGHTTGPETTALFTNQQDEGPYGPIVVEMLNDVGFQVTIERVEKNTVWLPQVWVSGDVKGDYDGIAFGPSSASGSAHVAQHMFNTQHSRGVFTAGRKWDDTQDKLDDLIGRAMQEFDIDALRSLVHEFQREAAIYQAGVSVSSADARFSMIWPWVENFFVFRTSAGRRSDGGGGPIKPYLHTWFDPQKVQ